jgi:hypothetical protein
LVSDGVILPVQTAFRPVNQVSFQALLKPGSMFERLKIAAGLNRLLPA